ncbi:MAG: hypothetical protein ACLRZH_02600 [Ruthenibacterium lactatiformans]
MKFTHKVTALQPVPIQKRFFHDGHRRGWLYGAVVTGFSLKDSISDIIQTVRQGVHL